MLQLIASYELSMVNIEDMIDPSKDETVLTLGDSQIKRPDV